MQIITKSWRSAALPALALACLAATSSAWAARTQEANVIPVVLFGFPPADADDVAAAVRGDLLLASDGNVYFGSTGGGDGTGAIAKLTPDGVVTTVYSLKDDGTEGLQIFGKLLQASDGNLYGTAYLGGDEGGGTLFKVTLDGTFTVLHDFGGGEPNAIFPYTGVTQGPDGLLYGTTLHGGEDNKGTIYRIATDGSGYQVIHEFGGSDGENPEGLLVQGADGLLYGTTMTGGSGNTGTIYRISTAGAYELLYSFPRLGAFSQGLAVNATGANPRAGLMLSTDGNFYGTAYRGGQIGHGTLFRMTPTGDVSVVHAFTGAVRGASHPLAGVIQDANGNFYGTSEFGGNQDSGAAWRVSASGVFSLLHGFMGSALDGNKPFAGLLFAHNTLYAVTYQDGSGSGTFGAISKLDLAAGQLPVELSASVTDIQVGDSVTLTWSAPAGYTCTKKHGAGTLVPWTGDAGESGSQVVTPPAGFYTFGLSCVEPDDGNTATTAIVRAAYVTIAVTAPPLDPVDGGGGVGSLSLAWLLLAAALLLFKVTRETRRTCP